MELGIGDDVPKMNMIDSSQSSLLASWGRLRASLPPCPLAPCCSILLGSRSSKASIGRQAGRQAASSSAAPPRSTAADLPSSSLSLSEERERGGKRGAKQRRHKLTR
jgi:hypothetical protein